MLTRGAGVTEIKEQAHNEGMVTLGRDGMMKARDEITTPYEVMRNVYTME